MLRSKNSRRAFAGVLLIALPVAAVLAHRVVEKPWIPACPAFRQHGRPDAPVALVEFSDFQCPACAAAVPTVHQIESQYGPAVHVYYKYLPWTQMHRWAKDAAVAAECAGQQRKFWGMHDLLFSKQLDWARSQDASKQFADYARSLGLDLPKFKACVQDPAMASAIEADVRDAKEHWVNSTPTFFINGRRFVGGQQLRVLGLTEIEKYLAP